MEIATAAAADSISEESDGGDIPAPGAATLAELPARLCPHCAALSHTDGAFCPYCGKCFSGQGGSGSSRMSTRVKVFAACVVALLVLGGAGGALGIKLHHDSQVAAQHRQAAAAAQARQQQQQQAQQAQQAQQQAEITQRQGLETQLQDAITKDATNKSNQGLLTSGPAQSTSCTPVSGGSSQNLSEATGTYSCIAIYQTNSDGTQSGYRYSGTINFDTGSMTWQLGGGGLGG